MLYFPTKVYPHLKTIDINKTKNSSGEYTNPPIFSFQFNGDSLAMWTERCYTLDNELVYTAFAPKTGIYFNKTNGEKVTVREVIASEHCSNGNMYKYEYILWQNEFTDPTKARYDMVLQSHVVKDVSTSNKTITIDSKITDMLSSYWYNNSTGIAYLRTTDTTLEEISNSKLVGGAYLVINGSEYFVNVYNSSTGVCYVDTTPSGVSVGDTYYILTSYLRTPSYYYKARNVPTISLDITPIYQGLKLYTNYSQTENSTIKSIQYSIYNLNGTTTYVDGTVQDYTGGDDLPITQVYVGTFIIDNIEGYSIIFETTAGVTPEGEHVKTGYTNVVFSYDTTTGIITLRNNPPVTLATGTKFTVYKTTQELIEQCEPKYSQDTEMIFPVDVLNNTYNIALKLITQDDVTVSYNRIFEYSSTSGELINGCTLTTNANTQSALLAWTINRSMSCYYRIYRRDITDSGVQNLSVYLGITSQKYFRDYTIRNNCKYQYTIVPCTSNGTLYNKYTKTMDSALSFRGWSISSLTETFPSADYGRRFFTIGDTWILNFDVTSSEYTNNRNINVYQGYSQYPQVDRNDLNYKSSTISASLETFNCTTRELTDSIQKALAWDKFINGTYYLLKTWQGDTFIIAVQESSRTPMSIGNKQYNNISISWVECADIEKCIIS